jgi:hypothetical protein
MPASSGCAHDTSAVSSANPDLSRVQRVARPRRTYFWVILLILGAGIVGSPAPAAAAATAAPDSASSTNTAELMYRLLFRLYELLGGDPAELVMSSLDQTAAAVNARFAQNGIPELNPEETTEFLLLLEQLLLGTKLPPPGMSLTSWIQLTRSAASMWLELTA